MPNIRNKRASVAIVSSAIVLMLGLSGCSKTQTSEKLLSDARQYQQKGDNKAAVIQLKNVLQKDPNNKDARYLLGAIYIQSGDPVSAEKELRKAVSLGLDPATALPSLAKSMLMQGQYQKLLDETASDPRAKTDADFSSVRANALMALGKNIEAKEAFNSALKSTTDFPEALIGLAKLAIIEHDMETANRYTNLATDKNPKHADAWLFKGDLLRGQGKSDEALVAYDNTTKISPNNAGTFLAKANLEIEMKKFAEAKQDVDTAKKLGTNQVQAFFTQALLDFSQNKFPAALESILQVEKNAPNYMPGILLSAAIQIALGANEQAEQHLKKYLESNPGHLYAQKLMVSVLLKSGQTARAVTQLEPLLKTEIIDSQLYALAGEAYMQSKNFTKATEYFEKASVLFPNFAEYHTALGLSRLGQGNSGKAISELEKAVDLNTKSPKAGVLLIMTHAKLKEYDKALVVAKATEKDHPENPLIKNLMGGIYLSKNDIPNARASFEKAIALQPTYFPAVANLAQLDLREKKPEAAKKRFETVLEKDKKNVQAMTALASLAVAKGSNDEAKTWLEKANSEQPDSLELTQLLAFHYARMGDKQKALVLVRNAQATNPKVAGFVELLAQIQMSLGDKAGALDSYSKFAAMLPESTSAQFKVATSYIAMGNEAAAIDALKKTLRMDGTYREAQLALSTLLAKKGSFDEALVLSRQIQKQDEKSPVGFIQEGDILLAQKKVALGLQSYERAAKLGKNGLLMTKIHRALTLDGKTKEADARINQWLKENPLDNNVRLYFAMYNMATQKTKQAGIEQLQIILKNDANNLVVLNNLAWALSEEKDPKSLEYAEKAYKLSSDSPAIMDTLGWILLEQGNIVRGLPLVQKAMAQMPDSLDVRYHVAVGLMKSGNKAMAKKEFEQILASGKAFEKKEEVKTLLKQL
ncbi:MAG: XrtA/PEP-CTERM system TPR-repeat protein PrsT [Pseudomonadota bacterium]